MVFKFLLSRGFPTELDGAITVPATKGWSVVEMVSNLKVFISPPGSTHMWTEPLSSNNDNF